VSKVVVIKIWRQHVRIKVIRLFNTIIPTIKVETIVAPATNFVRSGILVRFATNLGCGSGGVLVKRNLNKRSGILVTTTIVVRTPQMVFTNPKMTIHVNMIAYRPPMSSIVARRYKRIDARNLGKRY
jgi:hypothetical protein